MSGLDAINVLVVDDNAQMRTIIGAVLLAVGIRRIDYANNGAVGLQRLQARDIDIAFVDYEMPLMNGLAFIEAVRARQDDKRYLPIIMLTGHSDYRHICAARDAGMTEFLGKPVTAAAILARLSAVILQPRPFIEAPDFFGPDRRRRGSASHQGPWRRFTDEGAALEL